MTQHQEHIPQNVLQAVHALIAPHIQGVNQEQLKEKLNALQQRDSSTSHQVEEAYSIASVCRILKISRDTVLRMIRDDQIFATKIRYQWRIPASEVNRLTLEDKKS